MVRLAPAVLAASLALTGAFFLDKADQFMVSSKSGKVQISSVKNDVRWRSRRSFTWNSISSGFVSEYSGRLQTFDDSKAIATVNDDYDLYVDENSIVDIDHKKNRLDLIKGRVYLKRKSSKTKPLPMFINNQAVAPSAGSELIVFEKPSESAPLVTVSERPSLVQDFFAAPSEPSVSEKQPEVPETEKPITVNRPKKNEVKKPSVLLEAVADESNATGNVPENDKRPSLPEVSEENPKKRLTLGLVFPFQSISISSDDFGHAKGDIFTYPGIFACYERNWSKDRRLRADLNWFSIGVSQNSDRTFLQTTDTGFYLEGTRLGAGVAFLGRDMLTRDSGLTIFSYAVPTFDVVYKHDVQSKRYHFRNRFLFTPFFSAIPLNGQKMKDLSGGRIKYIGQIFDPEILKGKLGLFTSLAYESQSFEYKTITASYLSYASKVATFQIGFLYLLE